jgi:hypothetical protein
MIEFANALLPGYNALFCQKVMTHAQLSLPRSAFATDWHRSS